MDQPKKYFKSSVISYRNASQCAYMFVVLGGNNMLIKKCVPIEFACYEEQNSCTEVK